MIFTKEQYDNFIAPIYLDDLCINDKDQEMMFLVFNKLDQLLQGEIISWGASDTVVREKLMKYLCDKLYGMTIEQYYESEIAKNYFENGTTIPINLNRL
jgi:hypothetical protein